MTHKERFARLLQMRQAVINELPHLEPVNGGELDPQRETALAIYTIALVIDEQNDMVRSSII